MKTMNAAMCTLCGGQCCKRLPGAYSPTQFGFTGSNAFIVYQLLRLPNLCIDWFGEGENKVFYLRPRKINEGTVAEKKRFPGSCIFLNEKTGCQLSEKNRPLQCLKLVPNYFHETKLAVCLPEDNSKTDVEGMRERWQPFQPWLKVAYNMVK